MATPISSVRVQFLFRRGARLFHRSIDGPMKPGLQNGYAITAFDSELELRTAVKNFKYSELFQQFEWKVGTAETTEKRLEKMFGIKRPLLNPEDIWERYYIPLNDRLSKYQGDTKSLEAGQCAFMKDVLIKKYLEHSRVAILMVPLILGFKGTANQIEEEMSEMIVKVGGTVHNDKRRQGSKERSAPTNAQIGLRDEDFGIDKLLKLTPTLQKISCELHPSYKRK
jgi:hypothetical protein